MCIYDQQFGQPASRPRHLQAKTNPGRPPSHHANGLPSWIRLSARTAGIFGFISLSFCQPHETRRQKLTLVVETPAGERSGSALVEVDGNMNRMPGTGNEINYTVRGEATVVELSPGRYLFALIRSSEQLFYAAAVDRFESRSHKDWLPQIPRQIEPVSLLSDLVPTLFTFEDALDPLTVEKVDPQNLAATFGPGVSLKSATLEITRERLTEGEAQKILPWLGAIWPNRLDGQRFGTVETTYPFANSLGSGDFSTEIDK